MTKEQVKKEVVVMKIIQILGLAQEQINEIKNTTEPERYVESAQLNLKLADRWIDILKSKFL